jgi:hypothetical protein
MATQTLHTLATAPLAVEVKEYTLALHPGDLTQAAINLTQAAINFNLHCPWLL